MCNCTYLRCMCGITKELQLSLLLLGFIHNKPQTGAIFTKRNDNIVVRVYYRPLREKVIVDVISNYVVTEDIARFYPLEQTEINEYIIKLLEK